jgi:hypothetical protein
MKAELQTPPPPPPPLDEVVLTMTPEQAKLLLRLASYDETIPSAVADRYDGGLYKAEVQLLLGDLYTALRKVV